MGARPGTPAVSAGLPGAQAQDAASTRTARGRRTALPRLAVPGSQATAREVRPLLLVLGLPTLGLSFAITILTTYGPVVLLRIAHSTTKVGALIGGEGAFALFVPLLAGALSDRLPANSPRGRRLPFVYAGAPLMAAGLVVVPFAAGYPLAAGMVLMFFIGYYLYYPPYRAIYADLLPRVLYARAQASQALARGAGLGVALVAGGLLLGLWAPLPFALAAGVMLVVTLSLEPIRRLQKRATSQTLPYGATSIRDLLLRNRSMQAFAVANACIEFSFAGLKSFIVLYVVKGLGRSPALASAVIAGVAVAYVVGAPVAGRLADRFGIVRVLVWASAVYGLGLCYGVVPHTVTPMVVALPVVALAGAVVMTLPQTLAFLLAPASGQGAAAGLVDFSRGIGLVLGPIAVGAAIGASGSVFPATHGYAIMWPAIGLPVLAAAVILRTAHRALLSTA